MNSLKLLDVPNPGNPDKKAIDEASKFLVSKKKGGQFRALWGDFGELVNLLASGEMIIADAWQPAVMAVKAQGKPCTYAVPKEGYRAWSIGVSPITGTPNKDAVIAYADYWLSGPPARHRSRSRATIRPRPTSRTSCQPGEICVLVRGQALEGRAGARHQGGRSARRRLARAARRDGRLLAPVAGRIRLPDEEVGRVPQRVIERRDIRQSRTILRAFEARGHAESQRASWDRAREPRSQLINVGKVYDDGTPAVIDFNLEVTKGEFIAFLGPSGCGKTTTLRMIAGFESITSGDILIRGKRDQRRAARAAADRDDLPELRAVSAHDRAR